MLRLTAAIADVPFAGRWLGAHGLQGRFYRLAAATVLAQATWVMVAIIVYGSLQPRNMADFHVMRDAAREILEGRSGGFVYPPPAAFLLIPFTFLPYTVAAAIWIVLILTSTSLVLYILDVRDWRCYALTLLAASSIAAVTSGSLSSFLALGTALLWRYRDRRWVAGLIVGTVVVAKLYLWPLLVWLVAVRRARTAALGFVTGTGLAFAGWAITGFAGLTNYPHRVSSVTSLEQGQSYSPVGLALSLGAPTRLGDLLAVVLGLALLAAAFREARRPDGERRSFVLAIAATFAFSPISWLHYFVLLAVPMALTSPALAPVWALPLGFWALPMKSGGVLWHIVLAWALGSTIVAATLRASREGGRPYASVTVFSPRASQ